MSLLASFRVRLEPLGAGEPITEDTGVKARGLAYDLIGEANPDLARRLHDSSGPKPFTSSMLLGRHARGPKGEALLSEGPYHLRYTALNEEVADALSATLYRGQATGGEVRIGSLPFRIRRVITASEEDYWAQARRYQDLAGAAPRNHWRLSFKSPTAFRQSTGHLPLPVPHCVFGSALDRWNAFCPAKLRMDNELRDTIWQTVFPDHLQLRSRRVDLGHGGFVGFVGRADFTPVARLDADDLAKVTALAEFMYFSGTGHGTTRGWGQVAVLDSGFVAGAGRRAGFR